MNRGVQKLLSLGASLGIGAGVGIFAKQGRETQAGTVPFPEGPRPGDGEDSLLAEPAGSPAQEVDPAEPSWFQTLSAAEKLELNRLLSNHRNGSRPTGGRDTPRAE